MTLSSVKDTLRQHNIDDFLCGCCGGVAKVLAGHPFDTIKGRVQSGMYKTPVDALVATIRNEGVSALYNGLLPPCAAVGFVSGTLFFVNNKTRKWLQPDPSQPLTYAQMLLAGSAGGAAVGCVVTPFELLKVNRQIQNQQQQQQQQTKGSSSKIQNSRATSIRAVLASHGPTGLYCGFVPTLIRETGTFGSFFAINEFFRDEVRCLLRTVNRAQGDNSDPNKDKPRLSIPIRVCCAGFAGMCCWFPFYPVDQVKTLVQVSGVSSAMAFRQLMVEGGVRRMYRGLTPCLLRAFPAYAAQYTTYEVTCSLFSD